MWIMIFLFCKDSRLCVDCRFFNIKIRERKSFIFYISIISFRNFRFIFAFVYCFVFELNAGWILRFFSYRLSWSFFFLRLRSIRVIADYDFVWIKRIFYNRVNVACCCIWGVCICGSGMSCLCRLT